MDSIQTGSGKVKQIPEAVIKRLPVYHRYLTELAKRDVERISSPELAAKIGITASQLRQDLSCFGSFGHQGYGYRIHELLGEISRILGLENEIPMVLVGVGHLGRAILSYPNFKDKKFGFIAIFDNNPLIIGEIIEEIPVLAITELESYLIKNNVEVGVITTPISAAQEVANLLIQGGVRGIWNFAPLALKVPDSVVVEHVHISESLLELSFKLQQKRLKS